MNPEIINCKIVPATIHDAGLLAELGSRTFSDTFAAFNSQDDIEDYIRKTYDPMKIQKELTERTISYMIAYLDDVAAGFAKLNHKRNPDGGTDNCAEIEKIFILNNLIGKKVGKALMLRLIDQARQCNYDYLWLGVWEKNERAIAFYKKFGFEIFGRHDFWLGKDKQNDLLMKRNLLENRN